MRKFSISISIMFLALLLVGQGCAEKANTPGSQDKKDQQPTNQQMETRTQTEKEANEMEKGTSEMDKEDSEMKKDTSKMKEESSEDNMEKDVDVPMKEVDVSGTEYDFSPSEIEVKKGQKVKINFTNEGNAGHNLVIPSLDVGTKVISGGESETITFTAPKTGTVELDFECTVPGHAQSGMTGKIDVE